jgi:predicted Rdx family selenoprotein
MHGDRRIWMLRSLVMTKLLEQAVARANALPESDQNAIAQIVLDELESERRWEGLFGRAPDKLQRLADEAWAEHDAGKSHPLEPDEL